MIKRSVVGMQRIKQPPSPILVIISLIVISISALGSTVKAKREIKSILFAYLLLTVTI
jgi:hypothetical protein